MSRTQRVRGTAIGNIAVIVVRQKQKPFTPAVTAIAMARGSSIPPASTGAQALAETAARRTTITLRTA